MRSARREEGWGCDGQGTLEYVLVIIVLWTAVLVMQTYVKRGLQARYRTVVDGAVSSVGAPTQYEPYYPSATTVTTQDAQATSSYVPGGTVTTTWQGSRVTDANATQEVGVDLQADDDWR